MASTPHTALRLDPAGKAAAQRRAAEEGRTLTEIVDEALARYAAGASLDDAASALAAAVKGAPDEAGSHLSGMEAAAAIVDNLLAVVPTHRITRAAS